MKKIIVVLLTIFVFSTRAFSYGPRGHHLVGAIADRRLLPQTQIATKVSQLLFTLMNGKLISAGKLHGYWDSQTVENAFGNSQDATVAKRMSNKEPANWKLTGGVESWGEKLANDILPMAREARTRLHYANDQDKAR